MAKDSAVMYRSFFDAVKLLDPEARLQAYEAYFDYAFDGVKYSGIEPVISALLTIIKPSLDKARTRYETAVENGKKGGAPLGNQNAKNNQKTTRKQPENNQKTTKKQPENNLYVDVDVDDDVYEDINNARARAKPSAQKPKRHKHGQYKHVALTDDEYDRLIADYGEEQTAAAIKKVDEYCEQHGKTYKNYNLTLRKWGFEKTVKLSDFAKEVAAEWG